MTSRSLHHITFISLVLGAACAASSVQAAALTDTPWFARSAADGHARVDAVPPGRYKLRVWHPGLPVNTETAPVAITLTAADADHRTPLAASAES